MTVYTRFNKCHDFIVKYVQCMHIIHVSLFSFYVHICVLQIFYPTRKPCLTSLQHGLLIFEYQSVSVNCQIQVRMKYEKNNGRKYKNGRCAWMWWLYFIFNFFPLNLQCINMYFLGHLGSAASCKYNTDILSPNRQCKERMSYPECHP